MRERNPVYGYPGIDLVRKLLMRLASDEDGESLSYPTLVSL
jgi:hypothetical protein